MRIHFVTIRFNQLLVASARPDEDQDVHTPSGRALMITFLPAAVVPPLILTEKSSSRCNSETFYGSNRFCSNLKLEQAELYAMLRINNPDHKKLHFAHMQN